MIDQSQELFDTAGANWEFSARMNMELLNIMASKQIIYSVVLFLQENVLLGCFFSWWNSPTNYYVNLNYMHKYWNASNHSGFK